jgi:EAL domain-containing protein (putative c-di-GMP-specific phosphodiesterase class I)
MNCFCTINLKLTCSAARSRERKLFSDGNLKNLVFSPEEFIPIVEDIGIIWELGRFTLETACEQATHWIKDYPEFGSIAVNVSGVHFSRGDLADIVKDILKIYSLPAHLLEIEITESAIISSAEGTIAMMHQLKDLGVRLSLDDFGTGYSSLNYLKRFPVDSLKIDRSFVAEIVQNELDSKVAEIIVKLAHDLSLVVVAEGIETQEQLAMLKNIGCDQLQGCIFSRPIKADDMTILLREKKIFIQLHNQLSNCKQGNFLA